MSREVKVGLVQMTCASDKAANIAKAIQRVRELAEQGADIVCLQELFASRYFCQDEDPENFDLADDRDGELFSQLSELASSAEVVVVAPYFERRAAGVYHNSVVVFDSDGSQSGHYRKAHIPDDPQFYEKFYFTPGDEGFVAMDTKAGRIGVLICWDQWFPEAARAVALRGAEILFYPTAIGWLPSEKAESGAKQHASWETIQRSHAIANGCFVASVNRVGHEPHEGTEGIEFWGQSFIADPSGEIVAKASAAEEHSLLHTIDLDAIETQRRIWPFLRDRRIDAYGDLTKRMAD